MLNLLTEAETTACPPAARGVLVQYLAGEISPEIALMHLLLAAGAMGPLRDCLERLRATGREPLVRLAQLAIEHRDGLQHAASLVEAGLTEARGDDRLAAIREQYDRAVATAPEAAVALYSLGAGIANVTFDVTGGRGLSQFAQRRFDLILAIDSFPCIVAASPEIARQHIHDAARLLRPGGSFAIFNYSYRGDIAADRVDVATHAKAAGLVVLRNGTRDLALWDGTSFLLKAVS
jgi:SAM-dependent methyltransferase